MPLTFPSNFRYFDDKRDAITIPARDPDSGRRVLVRVAMDLLTGTCGAADLQLLTLFTAYDRHRAQLQARASRAYDQGKIERDGSVALTVERETDRAALMPAATIVPGTRRGLGRLFAALRT
ncbi:DUF1488 family protein [Roseiterribacter gracilis]|uniref:Uncharacterized protein n=1 Tax=Roseiterribacter gracilis TaxID=2812848 RepID=A0A8S8X6C5_9PROT|nr:hypothetical protein TMPK1_04100 [Rhodospirillales bacterium TMPK1]